MGRSLAWIGVCAMGSCGPQPLEPSPWDRFDLAYLQWSGAEEPRSLALSDAAGSDQEVLVTQAIASGGIAWAPEGDRVAYLTEVAMRPDGGVERWAVRGVGHHDDRELAQIDRSHLGVSAASPHPSTAMLSWSPRGEHLAVTIPGWSEAPQCNMAGMELWRVALDPDAELATGRLRADVDVVAGTWSADGRGLAYAARYLVCGDNGELDDFGWDVHAVSVDPDESLGKVAAVWDSDEWGPTWAPRGQTIAYAAGARDPQPRSRIEVVDAPGEPPRVIVEVADCGLEVGGWFPDGERLLLRRTCASSAAHLVVDAARGTIEIELADLGAVVAISPDGDRVAYVDAGDAGPQVEVLDLVQQRAVTIGPGSAPAWRPR